MALGPSGHIALSTSFLGDNDGSGGTQSSGVTCAAAVGKQPSSCCAGCYPILVSSIDGEVERKGTQRQRVQAP